jgi:hypothetical protein
VLPHPGAQRADGARDKAKLNRIAEPWDDLGVDLNP